MEEFLNAVDSGAITSEQDEPYGNYNVAPTHEMPVAFVDENGKRILDTMHWGFMGWKPKPGKKPFLPINTRDDSLLEKPMWKKPFIKSRCIVPASGFYEWAGKKGNKTPHYIYPTKEKFMGFAGIFSDLAPEDKASNKSYSIITTKPNKVMEDIHDRMPVILHPSEFDDWLNPDNQDPDYLTDFLRPYPDDAIDEYIVSKAVGNVRNNDKASLRKQICLVSEQRRTPHPPPA
ncbi:MAG: SOS response-associated peptidase [Balneolaceae bacterium]|nr:SOS response-associated peptidase [Balneolaceae bacterium]